MKPSNPTAQALRNQAMALRQLATGRDAHAEIGRQSAFRIGDRWFHNDDQGPPDKGVPNPLTGDNCIPAAPLTAMELIDDACAFEAIATKLDR